MKLSVKLDQRKLNRKLADLKRQEPFMTNWAMRKAFGQTAKYMKGQMNTKLKGGALGFTKKGLQYEVGNYKTDNRGQMFFAADRFYMREVIFGGRKEARNKRIPEPITKNFRLTAKGNIPKNFQQQAILNQTAKGFRRVDLKARGKLSLKAEKRFANIFAVGGKGRKLGNGKVLPPGVYRQYKDGKIKMLISYKRSERAQRKTWDAKPQAIKYFQQWKRVFMRRILREKVSRWK